MSESYSGGCACGEIRYEAAGPPVFQTHCQCRHCQMRSGTGHGSFIVFAGAEAVSVGGRPKTWNNLGDSGATKVNNFCPTCGTPVFITFPADPGITAIHAGSLDDAARFKPVAITYFIRALDWDIQDPSLAAFDRMPG